MSPRKHVVPDGLVMGLIASVTVAVFYAVFDFLAARGTFYTVNLLGKAMFRGLRDRSILLLPVQTDTDAILIYNAVHLAISLAIGLTVAALVAHAERHPQHARATTGVIVAGFFITVVVVGSLTASFRDLLPWWSIVVANALAVVCAGLYLTWRWPGVWRHLLVPPRTA